MNRQLFTALVLLLLPQAPLAAAASEGEKVTLKLGLIPGETHHGERERKIDTEVLNAATDAFMAARRFKLVERNQLAAVFTEKSLQDFIGGKVNNKLTDVLDLDLVGVVGHTVETTRAADGKELDKWIIDVRLIEVKTAGLVATVTSDRASLQSMLPPASPREAGVLLADSVREAFPPLGYIVQIDGRDIIVDLGTDAGLKERDTLEVVQQGEQIIHPVTGQLLDAPPKVIGELKVVSISAQLAICKRTSGKGELAVASLVRLKGTTSAVVERIMRIPRIWQQVLRQKGDLQQKP